MISESLYQFVLHYAENISIQPYGSVEHEGYKITYLDTVLSILRVHRHRNEVEHNDELKKKGTDFIVFTILWGFIRKEMVTIPFLRKDISEEDEVLATDKKVLEYMLPRMKDKVRFLEDFGFPFERIEDHNSMRFADFIARLK